jgi:hypothetical protein
MSGKASKKMTRGLGPEEGPGFQRANTLNQNKFRKPMSGRLRTISMSTRVQEVIIQERVMTRYQHCLWSLYIPINNRHF